MWNELVGCSDGEQEAQSGRQGGRDVSIFFRKCFERQRKTAWDLQIQLRDSSLKVGNLTLWITTPFTTMPSRMRHMRDMGNIEEIPPLPLRLAFPKTPARTKEAQDPTYPHPQASSTQASGIRNSGVVVVFATCWSKETTPLSVLVSALFVLFYVFVCRFTRVLTSCGDGVGRG